MTTLGTLPQSTYRFAVASDGSLVAITLDGPPNRLMHLGPDGTMLWSWQPPDGSSVSLPALMPNDDVVVLQSSAAESSTVTRLSIDGTVTWSTPIDGFDVTGPAIAPDGSIRVVTGTDVMHPMSATTIVTALSPDGSSLWQRRLDDDYHNTWSDALVVGSDGSTFLRSIDALIALGPDGRTRWHDPMPGGYDYDAAIDAEGTLVTMFGPVHGLDAQTGAELWHVDGPNAGGMPYVAALALAPNRCLVGWSSAGGLFGACDP